MLVQEYIGVGKNTGRRVWHTVADVEEQGRALLLVTAYGLRMSSRGRKGLVLHTDDYERCPVCTRERFKDYRRI